MSPIVIFLVLAGLWLADATKQGVGMEQLRQEFDSLKLTIERKYIADIAKYKTDTEKYHISNIKMEEKVEMLQRQVDDLTITNGIILQQMEATFISGCRAGSYNESYTGMVAFYARIDGFTGSPTDHTVIPFDIVDLNVGSAYDPTNGEFTAPVDGLYSFSYEIIAAFSCETDVTCVFLYVDSVVVSQSCSVNPNSAGTAVTVQITAGQAVTLAIDFGASCESISLALNVQNKFSGHLLYEII